MGKVHVKYVIYVTYWTDFRNKRKGSVKICRIKTTRIKRKTSFEWVEDCVEVEKQEVLSEQELSSSRAMLLAEKLEQEYSAGGLKVIVKEKIKSLV
jgi:hypothetical protein